jgi:hypothetical protein
MNQKKYIGGAILKIRGERFYRLGGDDFID